MKGIVVLYIVEMSDQIGTMGMGLYCCVCSYGAENLFHTIWDSESW